MVLRTQHRQLRIAVGFHSIEPSHIKKRNVPLTILHDSALPILVHRVHGRKSLHLVLDIRHELHAAEDLFLFASCLALLMARVVGIT